MMSNRILLIAFMLATGMVTAGAQTRLTLEQAVALALEHNPIHKAAVFQQRAAAAGVGEARAALLPQITFSQSYLRGNDPVYVFGAKLRQQRFRSGDFALNVLNTPTPFGNFVTRFAGGWQLFDSGVSWMRVSQAKQMSAVAERHLERSEQELVFRVVEAYAAVLLATKQQHVAEDALKTSQAILDRSRARFDAGMVVESDLLSARVNHAARQQELIRARNGVHLAKARLMHELGMPSPSDYELVEVLAERALPDFREADLEKRALDRRPDMQGIELRTDAQRKATTIAKAAFGPRINLFANWELDNPHFGGGGGNNWMSGVELQLDIFAGGAKRARLQRERALADEAAAQRDAMVSTVRLQVRQAYLDLDAARQQVEVARAAVEQAKESLRIGQNRYEAGLSTIADLLQTQEASLRAETDYWQAVYRLHISYASLELATGTLDANSPAVRP